MDECLPALVHLYTVPAPAVILPPGTRSFDSVGGERRQSPCGEAEDNECLVAATVAEFCGAAADAARCLCSLAGDPAVCLDPRLVVLPLLPLPATANGSCRDDGSGGAAVQRCVTARLAAVAGEGGERARRLVDGPGLDVLVRLLADLAPSLLAASVPCPLPIARHYFRCSHTHIRTDECSARVISHWRYREGRRERASAQDRLCTHTHTPAFWAKLIGQVGG